METTKNLGLVKEGEEDFYSIETVNGNLERIDGEFAKKVDKMPGKGLSANDFTDVEKSKLAGIEAVRVKGSAEGAFRTGDVNLTADNVGAYGKLNLATEGYSYVRNCIMISNIDLNTVNESGLYFCSGPTNGPIEITGSADSKGNGFMVAITYAGATRGMQVFFALTQDMVYKRQNTGGTWGSWEKLVVGSAESASAVKDANGNGKDVTLSYYKPSLSSASYLAAWNLGELRAIHPASVSVGKATQDGNGNVISDTYQKKAWLYKGKAEYRGGFFNLALTGLSEVKFVVTKEISSNSVHIAKEITVPAGFIASKLLYSEVVFDGENNENFKITSVETEPRVVKVSNNYYMYDVEVYAK